MASSAAQISLLLLLTLLSSLNTHARDSQFFNKVPSTTTTDKEAPTNQKQQEDPDFLPQKDNAYGLYGHESGLNPPSTTTATTTTTAAPYNTEFKQPTRKYLPKNYNPVAYVTQPEDINDVSTTFTQEKSFSTNPTNYHNGEKENHYNAQQEEETEFRSYPGGSSFNRGGATFNHDGFQPQGMSDTRVMENRKYFYDVNTEKYSRPQGATFNHDGFQPQGMSDTRLMENGKYFYDVGRRQPRGNDVNTEKYSRPQPYERLRGNDFNTEKYSRPQPYERLRGARVRNEYNNRNSENVNGYEFDGENSMGGYQNQEEFQEEENLP